MKQANIIVYYLNFSTFYKVLCLQKRKLFGKKQKDEMTEINQLKALKARSN